MRIDIPTALTTRETAVLQSIARGKTVVEAGSLLGYSTVALAKVAKHVVSIDPHDGYPYWQPRPTLDVFRHNIRRFAVEDRVRPVVGFGQDHLPQHPADVAFLDLTGTYDDTLRCMEVVKAKALCVHDYARGGCGGATEAIDHFIRKNRCVAHRVDTTVIIERKV